MDRAIFYAGLRKRGSGVFGSSLSEKQVDTLEMILDEGQVRGMRLPELAYVLATTYHEVGPALQPKAENLNYSAGRIWEVWPSRFRSAGDAKAYANNPRRLANRVYAERMGNGPEASGDGWKYRGRGFCQITGEANYAKFSRLLGVDLVTDPDRAMEPRIAILILFEGMIRGLFTGKKLSDYCGDGKGDYVGARSVINADVARNGVKIAGYARAFDDALEAAGYAGQASKAPATSVEGRAVFHAGRQDQEMPAGPTSTSSGDRPLVEVQPIRPEDPAHPRPETWLARLVAFFTAGKEG